jgi:hypothetical protein
MKVTSRLPAVWEVVDPPDTRVNYDACVKCNEHRPPMLSAHHPLLQGLSSRCHSECCCLHNGSGYWLQGETHKIDADSCAAPLGKRDSCTFIDSIVLSSPNIPAARVAFASVEHCSQASCQLRSKHEIFAF